MGTLAEFDIRQWTDTLVGKGIKELALTDPEVLFLPMT